MSVEYIGHNVTDLKKLVYEKPVEDGLYTRFVKEQQKKHKEALRIKQKHQNETLKQKEQFRLNYLRKNQKSEQEKLKKFIQREQSQMDVFNHNLSNHKVQAELTLPPGWEMEKKPTVGNIYHKDTGVDDKEAILTVLVAAYKMKTLDFSKTRKKFLHEIESQLVDPNYLKSELTSQNQTLEQFLKSGSFNTHSCVYIGQARVKPTEANISFYWESKVDKCKIKLCMNVQEVLQQYKLDPKKNPIHVISARHSNIECAHLVSQNALSEDQVTVLKVYSDMMRIVGENSARASPFYKTIIRTISTYTDRIPGISAAKWVWNRIEKYSWFVRYPIVHSVLNLVTYTARSVMCVMVNGLPINEIITQLKKIVFEKYGIGTDNSVLNFVVTLMQVAVECVQGGFVTCASSALKAVAQKIPYISWVADCAMNCIRKIFEGRLDIIVTISETVLVTSNHRNMKKDFIELLSNFKKVTINSTTKTATVIQQGIESLSSNLSTVLGRKVDTKETMLTLTNVMLLLQFFDFVSGWFVPLLRKMLATQPISRDDAWWPWERPWFRNTAQFIVDYHSIDGSTWHFFTSLIRMYQQGSGIWENVKESFAGWWDIIFGCLVGKIMHRVFGWDQTSCCFNIDRIASDFGRLLNTVAAKNSSVTSQIVSATVSGANTMASSVISGSKWLMGYQGYHDGEQYFFSDERLKTCLGKIGTFDGVGVYIYRYKSTDPTVRNVEFIGVSAQELQQIPHLKKAVSFQYLETKGRAYLAVYPDRLPPDLSDAILFCNQNGTSACRKILQNRMQKKKKTVYKKSLHIHK
jgi:hypothetical protein